MASTLFLYICRNFYTQTYDKSSEYSKYDSQPFYG